MMNLSAITLFCDDVREEVEGSHTIVGVLPYTVQVQQIPFAFPKLAIYTRMNVGLELNPGTIDHYLKFPDGSEQKLGEILENTVNKALSDAKGVAQFGIALGIKVKVFNLNIPQEGKIISFIRTNLGELVTGSLNITLAKS